MLEANSGLDRKTARFEYVGPPIASTDSVNEENVHTKPFDSPIYELVPRDVCGAAGSERTVAVAS
jgi:hypothetical protein